MSALLDALSIIALGCPVEIETEHGWVMVLATEMSGDGKEPGNGRVHRLLANHPERPIRLPEWARPSLDVIRGKCDACVASGRWRCDHAWPVPLLSPEETRREAALPIGNGPSCWDIVAALTASGCRPVVRGAFSWRSLCPLCRMRGKLDRRLYVGRDPETGRARLSSFCLCSRLDILAVLGLLPGGPDDA